ncbi:MAG: MFS transporter small subunit [Rhodococcus sp. (in: high G+C Gram-positive bacteria)]
MSSGQMRITMGVAWLWVTVPFAYGVYELVLKAKNLFGS